MNRLLLLALPLGLLLVGCHHEEHSAAPSAPPPVAQTTIKAGTPVDLVLFDELTSGGSKEGDEVRLALAQPIDGLPAMCPVKAVVAWSRTEGTLGALTNRPARLTLTLQSLKAPGGEEIPLSADPNGPKDYELNRDNTGRPAAKDLDKAGPDTKAAQQAIQELIQKGQTSGLDAKSVADLAHRLDMTETARLADAGQFDRVQSLCRAVRGGTTVAGLASGGTVAAAMELVNIAGDVGSRLQRALGGRNIHAYPGTIVKAYVAKDTAVTLP